MKKSMQKFATSALFVFVGLSVSAFGYAKPAVMRTTPNSSLAGNASSLSTSPTLGGALRMVVETSRPRIINKADSPISSAVTAGLIQIYFVTVSEVSDSSASIVNSESRTVSGCGAPNYLPHGDIDSFSTVVIDRQR